MCALARGKIFSRPRPLSLTTPIFGYQCTTTVASVLVIEVFEDGPASYTIIFIYNVCNLT